jgi:ribonuclease P protein component
MKAHRLPKGARLLRTADYRKVYAKGRRRNLDWLLAIALATGSEPSRVGYTLPGAFGTAVERNRTKRRLREAVRRNWADLGAGWDIVLQPRRAALSLAFADLEATVRALFQSCARAADERGLQKS